MDMYLGKEGVTNPNPNKLVKIGKAKIAKLTNLKANVTRCH